MTDLNALIERLSNRFTGGRPMKKVCRAFNDCVSGETVSYWIDRNGDRWLATGRWSLFRVRPQHGPEIWIDEASARTRTARGKSGAEDHSIQKAGVDTEQSATKPSPATGGDA